VFEYVGKSREWELSDDGLGMLRDRER